MQLHEYLKSNGIALPAFARTIGVSVQAVHRYAKGGRTPRPKVMDKIITATAGEVQPNDFYSKAA